MDTPPLVAAIRFGNGRRLGEPLPDDALAWLDAQTVGAGPPLPWPEGYDTPPTLAVGFAIWMAQEANPPKPGEQSPVNLLFSAEQLAWAGHQLRSDEPFRDRLTSFWLNHFTVSLLSGLGPRVGVGPMLRDAIRPHVGGRFGDMLNAVSHSAAMIYYLDQDASVGPNSTLGKHGRRGMNENLAREILELHTLSPAGGYTQADVTEMARLMTGWGVQRKREPFDVVFTPTSHEPGEKTVLGRRFPEGGEAYAAALSMLATHPATQRHLATKLVRHFVADNPPPAAVAKIEGVLRDTGSDLGAAARALVRLPEAWAPPLTKLRSPQDYVLAIHRAVGGTDAGQFKRGTIILGQQMWNAAQPNGWPDTAAGWSGPEPMMQRIDVAYDFAARSARNDPMLVLESALGPLARAETRSAVQRSGSRRDALTLLFASREMQRR
ncbi:uncharacterized protein (DUF1800 family) [Humitalea rosea]|uniref:Uncharacterized protein (DUF1800 family) n=1 Tax=Humitalea rosea TaxID=990373 RepID=A0A2W7I839_9PROT|nr:DUF1800 domain-containing protein [Humitalea rosea]PZW43056.1 uncharacterized protein (DUF1800 family) [Humitalea rosea]